MVGRDFAESMKYFRHILMGDEIFLKIFDGPQKAFSCFLFLIFLVASFKKLRGPEHKIFKLAIKVGHVIIQMKYTQVYTWQMVIKIQKDHFYAFLADTEICVISNGTKDTLL